MVIDLYKNIAKDIAKICLYFGEGGSTGGFNYCFDVVNSIADYAGDKVDVWDNGAQKWYKRNNLGNYEPYGIIEYVNDLSSTTYYVGKLVVYDNHEYERTNSGWTDLGELEGEAAELPDVPFSINVNAKDYDSTTKTFNKTDGQLVDTNLTFTNGQPTAVYDDHIHVPSGCLAPYAVTYQNYFNRNSSNPNLTIISKTANVTGFGLLSNRAVRGGMNWMYRIHNEGTSEWLTLHGTSEYGRLNSTSDPTIFSARVDSNNLLTLNNWTEETSTTASFTYGYSNSGAVGVFAGYGDNNYENFVGDFYWVYMSQNTLTDEQIQQVIVHNEIGSTIVYPKEYTERESPVVVLVFESIEEANAYRDCVYDGQVALIDGEGYIMSEALGEWIEAGEVPDYLCFTAEEANSTFKFVNNGTSNPDVEYSTNGFAFSPLAADTVITLPNVGDKVYLRGNNPNGWSSSTQNYTKFVMTGQIAASGTVMSLIDIDDFDSLTEIPNNCCFIKLFQGCGALTSAPEFTATVLKDDCYYGAYSNTNVLPDCSNIDFESASVVNSGGLKHFFLETKVTDTDLDDILPHDANDKYCLPVLTLTKDLCYEGMFQGCTLLQTAPELPATTLSRYCYGTMFASCSALTSAPSLPATVATYACYNYMFSDCTSLTTAPSLPATTLAGSCYQGMFRNCSSLTTAPQLPATTLAQSCYKGMFQNCSRLTTAPELPATTMASDCYRDMFNGCSRLTTAPSILPATTMASSCCRSMFQACESLTTAPELPATTMANECYQQMFTNCRALTSAPALPATTLASSCYNGMFDGCWLLTTAPALPATTLASYCYREMFRSCSSLTTAPALPATTLNGADYCYQSMFQNCSALTSVPSLPATTLASYCYNTMFKGCTSLTTAPSLPATVATRSCYQQMFYGCTHLTTISPISITTFAGANNACDEMFSDCTSLTTIPSGMLPALTLGDYCYSAIFQRCTSLTTVPSDLLPAQVLTSRCYQYMFNGCSALTTAPDLPATTLVDNCYGYMFQNCTNLNYIKAMFTNNPNTSGGTSNWVQSVASSGTFVMNGNATWSPDSYRNANGVPANWTVNTATPTPPASLPDYLCFTAQEAGSTVKIYNNRGIPQNVEYTTDNGATWNAMANNTPITLSNIGDKMYVRGDNPNGFSGSDGSTRVSNFLTSGSVDVSGNIMSLLSKTDFESLTTIPIDYCFNGLFRESTSLRSAENLKLPALTLTRSCYRVLFYKCTSLTTVPTLPATSLANYCYESMFSGCSSLTTAPELPATTLASDCYSGMFYGCTSLTTAPELPATTLAESCYHSMFEGCTSLTTAPALPANVAGGCYNRMFRGCTSLTAAPALPSTYLASSCYSGMFEGCTSLTTAPELPATALRFYCYQQMFYGCTNLSYIKAMFTTTPSTSYTSNWVNGVASSGTFVYNSQITWNPNDYRNANGIPLNWALEDENGDGADEAD